MSIIFTIKDNDWNSVRQAIQKLASTKLGSVATPTFQSLNLTTLSVGSATISSMSFSSAIGMQSLGVVSATVSSLAAVSTTFGDAYITAPNQIYLLDHDLFAGFVADEHIPHSGVIITANAPLSGGGTISATRTFSLAYTSTFSISTGALHAVSSVLGPFSVASAAISSLSFVSGTGTSLGVVSATVSTLNSEIWLVSKGVATFGVVTTDCAAFSTLGNQTFIGGAGFYPRVLNQSAAPAAGTGATQVDTSEFIIWEDADNTETWLVYNRGGSVKGIKVETL